jgi:hypothetical protein
MAAIDEIREKLRPMVGKRVKVRGILDSSREFIFNHRDIGSTCIQMPEIDGEIISGHIWVTGTKQPWAEFKGEQGTQVSFTAIVKGYEKGGAGPTNYCLTNPDELTLLHFPSVKIPEPVAEENNGKAQAPPQPTPEMSDERAIEVLQLAKKFVAAAGGTQPAVKVAEVLSHCRDLPRLLRWVRALCGGEEESGGKD